MLDGIAYRYIGSKLKRLEISCDLTLQDLIAVSGQTELADKNIASFMNGGAYLNMLFWGEKGSGKSTLLRLLALKYGPKGLVTIELMDDTMEGIYSLYDIIRENADKKFILFFDDISFNEVDASYRRFKSALEGGLEEKPVNLLIVATSNRRHILSERALDTSDIYDKEEMFERTSLQARFGLSIGFFSLSKDDYLRIVELYLNKYNVNAGKNWRVEAEAYAIDRGGRSGRLAKQFAAYLSLVGDL